MIATEKPILTIKPASGTFSKATAHLLPCRIHYDGPVDPVDPFWDPKTNSNEANGANTQQTQTAYFRGRKLLGTPLSLPQNYRGVIAVPTAPEDTANSQQRRPEEEHIEVIDLDPELLQGSLEAQAEFDKLVVWGHETTVDGAADPYVRAVEEWIVLAEKIHTFEGPSSEENKK